MKEIKKENVKTKKVKAKVKKDKKKLDKSKLFTRIMAGLLVFMMLLSVFATVIYILVIG